MTLVDTSVWIDVFLGNSRPLDLVAFVPLDDVVTCLPVVQEVLQGFQEEDAYRLAREAMLALPGVESPLTVGLVEDAVGLFRAARRHGLTVRSSVECLIAACALQHDLDILHRDRDLPKIARVSALKERSI